MPVFPHIETSQLICCANQLTDFHMRATLVFNGLNSSKIKLPINALKARQTISAGILKKARTTLKSSQKQIVE